MKKGIVVTIHSDILMDEVSPKESKKKVKKIAKQLKKTLGKRVMVIAMRTTEHVSLIEVK